jgi:hypothetical protein
MKKYIGSKLIQATPMNRADYNAYRGWELPTDENGADQGYLVEYIDGGKPNHEKHQGYISWSPKEQFDNAYQETTGLSFGMAIAALKMGFKVSRSGWNGKNMWLILVPGTKDVNFAQGSPYYKAGLANGEILPHIDMYTTNSEGRRAMLPGWLASQTDMLSNDWVIVD